MEPDEARNAAETYQYLAFEGAIFVGNPSNLDVIGETHPIPVTVFDIPLHSKERGTTELGASIKRTHRHPSRT